MPTITTTVTSACATGATTTVTTTEATPENAGLTTGGTFNSWVLNCPASVALKGIQFDEQIANMIPFSDGLITGTDSTGVTPGCVRNIYMQGADAPFVEELIAIEDNGFCYKIQNGWFAESLGVKDYVATFNVVAVQANTCVVTWSNQYKCADPAFSKEAIGGLLPLFSAFIMSHEAKSGFTWDGMFNTFPVNAPADKVGALIQFDTFMELDGFADIGTFEVDGGHVGATRTILTGGMTIVEKCGAQDANGYSYYFPEGGEVDYGEPFKMCNYVGTMSVAPATATTSVVTWTNTYQTSDAAHSKAAVGGFVPLIKGLFDSIPAKLAAASASVI